MILHAFTISCLLEGLALQTQKYHVYKRFRQAFATITRESNIDFRSAIRPADHIFITIGFSGSEFSTDRSRTWYAFTGPGFYTLSIGEIGRKPYGLPDEMVE